MTDQSIHQSAQGLALKTTDCYNFGRYGLVEWTKCAELLLSRGYSEPKAARILDSRIMRWAADDAGCKMALAIDLRDFLDRPCNRNVVAGLLSSIAA